MPSKPGPPPAATAGSAAAAAATISAAPELRDFKKEATAFMPASMRRKKGAEGARGAPPVNAAPGAVPMEGSPRPDLLGTLKDQLGMAQTPVVQEKVKGKKDDYAKFVDEMGDLLG